MAIVSFVFKDFVTRYPEFASVTPEFAMACFSETQLYCDNSDRSPVQSIVKRTAMLYALTGHIIALSASFSDRGQLVGRVSSAGEGSVNISTTMGSANDQNEWFNQTQYGASFWRMAAPFRLGRFLAPFNPSQVFLVDD